MIKYTLIIKINYQACPFSEIPHHQVNETFQLNCASKTKQKKKKTYSIKLNAIKNPVSEKYIWAIQLYIQDLLKEF
jgi:hypothetical protein